MKRSQKYMCPTCGWGTTLHAKDDQSTQEFWNALTDTVPCGNRDINCRDSAVRQRYIEEVSNG